MVNMLRKTALILLILSACLFLADMLFAGNYITIEYISVYLFCAVLLFAALFVCLCIIKALYHKKKALSLIIVILLSLMTAFSCLIVVAISKRMHRDPHYSAIKLDGLPNGRELVLYEYGSFGSTSGCICIKLNDHVCKKLPDTKYTIGSGHSLSEPDNLILEYVPDTNELKMKYKAFPEEKYTEIVTSLE